MTPNAMEKARAGFPKRLAKIRGKRSQAAFGRELGVPQQNMNLYERGIVTPTFTTLCKIGIYEGVSLDWLVLGRGAPGKEL